MDPLLTAEETSKLLNVSYKKVLDLIHMGELQAHRIGGQFRITMYAIHEFLDKSKYKSYWKNR